MVAGVPLIFEKSKEGKEGFGLSPSTVPEVDISQTLGKDLMR